MRIGIPKETKNHEYRVALSPPAVSELTKRGHEVIIEKDAGAAIGFDDQDYLKSGAKIEKSPQNLYEQSELILKVKDPSIGEISWLSPEKTIFSYLHLAALPKITSALMKSGTNAIAFETIEDKAGNLPLLAPMSQIAGRLSVQAGAHALEMAGGGRGVLLGGAAGVLPANVVIIGGGIAGENAATMAMGLGADVTIMDINPERLRALQSTYGSRLKTLHSTPDNITNQLNSADLVIGAVLITGARSPKLITRDHIKTMKRGSVIVDIGIDQGGISETSKPTTHAEPTYEVDGVIHYCVTNMPGAVAATSTLALSNAIMPYVQKIADLGVEAALRSDTGLRAGLNVYQGSVTHRAVAKALGKRFRSPATVLGGADIQEVA